MNRVRSSRCAFFNPLILSVAIHMASLALLQAAIIGTNLSAKPLTAERIRTLPASAQPAWKEYLDRSNRQRLADREALRKEMREHGAKQIVIPPEGRTRRRLPLDRPDSWYGEAEARHIADN